MKKLIASTFAAAILLAGPAQAGAIGVCKVNGPYSSSGLCLQAKKQAGDRGLQTQPCYINNGAWYFLSF